MAIPSCRKLLIHPIRCARASTLERVVSNIAAKIPMMAMTTSSSVSENAEFLSLRGLAMFKGYFISSFLSIASNYAVGMSHLQRAIEESIATLRSLSALEEPLNRAAELLARCLTSGHKLLVCGNGGSASDATHLATEFLCRFRDERRPYPAISLTANGEFMTAVSVGTITLLTFAISGLAIGAGTVFPQFETENAAQIPTSFGGLIFMMTAVTLIGIVIVLEARPVYSYLSARAFGTPIAPTEMVVGFAIAALLYVAATLLPIHLAVRRLIALER